MALGPKFGGDIFSGEDLDILRVVARQIGPVIENIHLLNRLREYATELEARVKSAHLSCTMQKNALRLSSPAWAMALLSLG